MNMNSSVKSVLFCGKPELTKSFIFEAAIHWAEEGHRVIYIAPEKLQSLPSIYHDKAKALPDAYKQLRFMYLSNYEVLIEQLIDLHTFASVPTVLVIDNLDHYIADLAARDSLEMHTARLCAVILFSLRSCAKVLGRNFVFFSATLADERVIEICRIHFDNFYHLYEEHDENEKLICLKKGSDIYKYKKLSDSGLLLKQIVESISQ